MGKSTKSSSAPAVGARRGSASFSGRGRDTFWEDARRRRYSFNGDSADASSESSAGSSGSDRDRLVKRLSPLESRRLTLFLRVRWLEGVIATCQKYLTDAPLERDAISTLATLLDILKCNAEMAEAGASARCEEAIARIENLMFDLYPNNEEQLRDIQRARGALLEVLDKLEERPTDHLEERAQSLLEEVEFAENKLINDYVKHCLTVIALLEELPKLGSATLGCIVASVVEEYDQLDDMEAEEGIEGRGIGPGG